MRLALLCGQRRASGRNNLLLNGLENRGEGLGWAKALRGVNSSDWAWHFCLVTKKIIA